MVAPCPPHPTDAGSTSRSRAPSTERSCLLGQCPSLNAARAHGAYVSTGARGDRSVVYQAADARRGRRLVAAPTDWFEDAEGSTYDDASVPLRREVGPRTVVRTERMVDPSVADKDAERCMFWVRAAYQADLCVHRDYEVSESDTLFWIDGVLYKQRHETTSFLDGDVVAQALFHFQEWKRYYRSSQIAPLSDSFSLVNAFVLTEDGVSPLPPPPPSPAEEKDEDPDDAATPEPTESVAQLVYRQVLAWRTATERDRTGPPHATVCLRSSVRNESHPRETACRRRASWRDPDAVEVLNTNDVHATWAENNVDAEKGVTLALTLRVDDDDRATAEGRLDLAATNVDLWGANEPCVLLIHVAGGREGGGTDALLRARFGGDARPSCLVGVVRSDDDDDDESRAISRKALTNLAVAAAPTRYVAAGLEIERGLLLSREFGALARGAAAARADALGSVLLSPRFAITKDDDSTSISVARLWREKRRSEDEGSVPPFASRLAEAECAIQCDHTLSDGGRDTDYYAHDPNHELETTLHDSVHDLWWEATQRGFSDDDALDDSHRDRADRLTRSLVSALVSSLHPEHESVLRNHDEDPLLVFDRVGPRDGVLTDALAPEVDELGGDRCHALLRTARLAVLGYDVRVLPGAFAASTRATRRAAGATCDDPATSSSRRRRRRCGCDSYKEHRGTLETVVRAERNRALRTTILWDERDERT